MRLYLLRHGLTTHNHAMTLWQKNQTHLITPDHFAHSKANVPLLPQGEKQAISAGELIRGLDIAPTRLLSSDFTRAIDTANLLKLDLPLELHPELREQDWGELDNGHPEKTRAERSAYQNIQRSDIYARPLGGESIWEHWQNRTAPFFKQVILPLLSHEVPLIVCHGGTMRTFMLEIEKIKAEKLAEVFPPFRYNSNCQLLAYSDHNPETNERADGLAWVASYNALLSASRFCHSWRKFR